MGQRVVALNNSGQQQCETETATCQGQEQQTYFVKFPLTLFDSAIFLSPEASSSGIFLSVAGQKIAGVKVK